MSLGRGVHTGSRSEAVGGQNIVTLNEVMVMRFAIKSAVIGAGLVLAAAASCGAAELKFEHVMNIGSTGTGEGQFKYVEDFAFTKDGHLLATDALHAWVQVFDKTTGKFVSR